MFKKLAVLAALSLVLGGAAVAEAGRVNGPGSDVFTVSGFGSSTYHERFFGNQLAEVVVLGNGRSTLDVFVYDDLGNLIVNTSGPGDQCRVSWRPRFMGTFRVVVINRGGTPNTYVMTTN